ncbi:uncharacterized protein LOC100368967 [Saccoglossus kowalevskii]|uniref:Uncharacterized protein LOC100368967 n=1 Tax=Saccoglossus kowalevskii TaxID=10224 RepID=A0ABM0LUE8_SACKO
MVITLLLVLLIGSQPAKFNVKGQCTIGETTCNDDNGMVCYDEICDNSNDCQDTSDETTSSCIWKGLLKIEYNFTIWVEHVNDGHNQFSQFFGRLVGDTTSIQLTEEIDEDIYTFAIDHNIKAIFYADSKHKQIKQIRYDKLPRVKTIYTGTSSKVTDIDIDIISHNVYWIDDQYNAIVILDYEGTYHRQIITGLDKPIGLAIDSYHGHVYWSDCSDSTPRIERCTLSGDGRETFYNITSGCPTGITVHNDRLFYLDTINHHLIELNLYSDADPVVIWKDTNTPEMSLRDVAVSVTSYILTNSANKEIIEKGGELLIKSTNGTPYAIQYISPQDFTDDSCSNSSCDQLCTIDVSAPQCLCGQGYDLIIDIYSTSCQPDEMIISRSEFILANDTHILGLPGNFIDIQPANYLIHSISKTARVTAIDFNWSLKTLYYSTQRGVYSLLLDKGHQPLRINNDETVKALAVDWYSGNVYYVGEEGITVSTHDGAVFEALESIDLLVTDIAVHPGQMSLFVSSWDEDRGKILKTYLDGSNQTVLYENSNMKPVAITANYNFERLYWYDVISKRIMSIDFYGNDVHMADPLGISFTDITLFQNYLYWSDASKSSVNAVSLNNNTSHIMSVNTTGAPRTIVMFDESRQPQGETAYICSDDCDRLCLVSPSGSSCVGTRIGTTVYPTSQQTAIISLTAESLQTTQSDVTEFLSETINEEVSETYTVTVEFTEDKTTHMYNATQPTTIIKDEHTTIEKITEVTTEEQTTDVTVTTTPSPITAFTTTTVTTRQNPTTASPTTTLTTRPSPTTAFPMTTVTTSSATASPATTQSTPLTTRKTGAITQSKLPNIIPDENAPELDHCDEKITAETTKLPVKVKDLTGPIFIDDEGSDVYVTSDISVIKVWGESTVTYTGCDSAGNCAPDTCQTIVEVIYPRCPSLSNPTNGELRCTEVEFEILCMVVCDPGFAQPNGVSTEWSCTTNTGDGQWIPGNNVPPCQKTTSKQAAFSGSFPFEGRTTDSFSVEVLGQSFAKSLTAGLAVCASKVAYCSVFLGESTGVSRGGRSISQKREPVVRKRETPISTDSTTILNFTMTAEL